ncbi:pyridine nucleotide-disulfide oxidoreductase-like protein [Thermothelomyces thermophilus ATCC 42464]|uniref:Polycyclic ketone monooxygenase n=1 Tax=Thermothelomyces thermophilus (strain ATCC 42464 / BCRC 31852 / DSM 1799) TaxID=573729 RepID=BVMO_THET4|nr:pyridine nucleotide-disulfide oxidoreductase-like protein [Thermothelomyces thermophilus ATCC 42464]AEO56645.1 pyridine nucleotide-disulfide oxidoreductase-like protein [Thermothelomyces thermophilus ATCC 42464]5MQ6_A Chain A, Pyridine nucleotide-disulfide oxidoreductase-like protein [Thermothelomyces thermophilus]
MAPSAEGASGAPTPEDLKLHQLSQKYTAEAAKRFRPEGLGQFIRLKEVGNERFRALAEDPWVDHAALNAKEPVKDGSRYKFIILGAGYGGLLYAVRLAEAGLASGPDDILMVDAAGGFGGTWWWNRYPGLHCDVESYSYMPLLEETGYIPKSKYAAGPELLEHAYRIATQWKLHDKALFRSNVKTIRWDDESRLWSLEVTEGRGPGQQSRELKLQARYVLLASGILTNPQVPKIPGLETFTGPVFHTARWNYDVTGGSPTDEALNRLEGKRVGIIGTGATAIQVVPKLAKYAKELYVFQRTPSGVWWRGQRPTDPVEWKTKIARKKGWQRERMLNLDSYLTDAAEEGQENMVADGWTEMPAFSAVIGSPRHGIVEPTPEKIAEHLGRLYKLDLPHAEQVRARTDSIVKDPKTAAKLKAWYPTWCKRPTFSDEYLQTFNLPNVHLVDTDGKGVDAANPSGLVVADKEYPLDILVLSTGYVTPSIGGGSPAVRTGVDIYGRGGKSLDDKWQTHGAATLHGVCSNGFPNLFFTPLSQSSQAANNAFTLDVGTEHIVQVIKTAEDRVDGDALVEVTSEAEEAWSFEIMKHAGWFASVTGCTPGYITSEGEALRKSEDPMEMAKRARSGNLSQGMASYMKLLQEYRADGSLKGFDISSRA